MGENNGLAQVFDVFDLLTSEPVRQGRLTVGTSNQRYSPWQIIAFVRYTPAGMRLTSIDLSKAGGVIFTRRSWNGRAGVTPIRWTVKGSGIKSVDDKFSRSQWAINN
jgi:hypothetical protein